MPGAIFGGKVITTSTADHTYTFNEPVVTDWSQVRDLRFDADNLWVRRIDDALHYFVSHGRKEFVVQPFFIIEGTDFLVSMRGTTQAFLDIMDGPPGVREIYQIGFEAGTAWFEMKQKSACPSCSAFSLRASPARRLLRPGDQARAC